MPKPWDFGKTKPKRRKCHALKLSNGFGHVRRISQQNDPVCVLEIKSVQVREQTVERSSQILLEWTDKQVATDTNAQRITHAHHTTKPTQHAASSEVNINLRGSSRHNVSQRLLRCVTHAIAWSKTTKINHMIRWQLMDIFFHVLIVRVANVLCFVCACCVCIGASVCVCVQRDSFKCLFIFFFWGGY